MEANKAYENAKRRLEAKVAFRNHVYVYVFINLLLIIINLSMSSEYFWAKWAILGWGIGLLFHALQVFVFSSERLSVNENLIEKEMQKDTEKKSYKSNA